MGSCFETCGELITPRSHRQPHSLQGFLGTFFKSSSPQKVQKSFRRGLAILTSQEQIQSHLIGTVRESLNVPRAALFWLDADGNVFTPVVFQGFHPTQTAVFSFSDSCIAWMNVNRRHINLQKDRHLKGSMQEEEQTRWENWNLNWLFPFMSLNRLTGFLALGGKDFDASEIELLRSLVNLGGVALHSAALHKRQQEVTESFSRAEKLAHAGQFAAAAAHEIRNPLTSIRSTVQYIYKSFEEGDKRQTLAADVLEEVDRINGVVEGLLASVRPQAPSFQRTDLIELIQKTVRPLELKKELTVELDLDEKGREAICDPDQIHQVLLNLIQNSDQAMNSQGTLKVELRLESATDEKIRKISPHVFRIVLTDTGPGMTGAVMKRIFDPFYTTKLKDKGTGLGLSICQGIIEKHGGDIHVRSVLGEGSTFEILLPVNKM